MEIPLTDQMQLSYPAHLNAGCEFKYGSALWKLPPSDGHFWFGLKEKEPNFLLISC